MQPKSRGFPRSFRPSNQRRCFLSFWTPPGLARLHSRPGSCPACYRCGNTFTRGHLYSCPATRSECFVCGLLGHYAKMCFYATIPCHSHPRKTYPVATNDKRSFKNGSAKDGRTCNRTVSSVGSTDTQAGSKLDPTVGISEKKPQEVCVAIADISQCRMHLAQTKTLSKRRRDAKRIKDYYNRLELVNQLPFQHLSPEDIQKLFKPVVLQDHMTTLRNQNKMLNNVVSNLNTNCYDLEQRLKDLQQRQTIANQKIADLNNTITSQERVIAALRNTSSSKNRVNRIHNTPAPRLRTPENSQRQFYQSVYFGQRPRAPSNPHR